MQVWVKFVGETSEVKVKLMISTAGTKWHYLVCTPTEEQVEEALGEDDDGSKEDDRLFGEGSDEESEEGEESEEESEESEQ